MNRDDIGELRSFHGWVTLPDRKLGQNLQFGILRDHFGNRLQLRFSKGVPNELDSESPVAVTGTLALRPEADRRDVPFGTYELDVEDIRVYNTVKFKLPFKATDVTSVNLETRMRYRYLDLRYDWRAIRLRSRMQLACRNFLTERSFTEIETPILFKSTPEGAREFIVPTRRAGEFYALPQSPQQYKQILMASGINKYFQFAKCFRDEDLRADRQPEFTQVLICFSFAVLNGP